tara:strand:- start:3660 stop:4340 length:681 start_codon:yes stop_codon:yes gene_type:complete
MLQEHNVTISIDDLHPEEGWGCPSDTSVAYLENLWEEFDCKFTLFIPSNYHNKYPLSKYTDWVNYWLNKEWVELAAHGHYHQCQSEGIGECEFLELDYKGATDRILDSQNEWQSAGYFPKGFRMPGWLCNEESGKAIGENYKYVAIHSHLNDNIDFGTKTIKGEDGIHKIDSINVWNNNTFMFQSHIAGETNDNNWTEENYENFRKILSYLEKNYKLSYKTIGELI